VAFSGADSFDCVRSGNAAERGDAMTTADAGSKIAGQLGGAIIGDAHHGERPKIRIVRMAIDVTGAAVYV
jgi:hypothetical protein